MPGFVLTYQNLKSWAERLRLPNRWNDEVEQLAIRCRLLDTDVPLVFIPRPDRGMVTLAVTLPFAIPGARYPQIGESLTILNARSYMGAWILNADKGEVYFRITLPANDVEYGDEALRFVASIVVSSADAMAKALFAVAQQGAPPDVIAQTKV
jgi:hypothetical protein